MAAAPTPVNSNGREEKEPFKTTFNTCIDKRICLLKELEDKRETLKTQLQVLKCKRDDTEEKRRLDDRLGKKVKKEVERWLRNVHAVEEKIQEVDKEIEAMYSSISPVKIIDDIMEEVENQAKSVASNATNIRTNNLVLFGPSAANGGAFYSSGSTFNTNATLNFTNNGQRDSPS